MASDRPLAWRRAGGLLATDGLLAASGAACVLAWQMHWWATLLGALLSQRFAPVKDAPFVSPLSAGLHMLYCWVMLAVVIIAISTGYGRTVGSDDRREEAT